MRNLTFIVFLFSAILVKAGENKRVNNYSNNREQKQDARIQQGVKSGELNYKEAKRLQNQQNRIDKYQDKAAQDGVVTAKEKAFIQHKQNQASRSIYHQKHDSNKQPRAYDRSNMNQNNKQYGMGQGYSGQRPHPNFQQNKGRFQQAQQGQWRGPQQRPVQNGERYLEWKQKQGQNYKFDNQQAQLRRKEFLQKQQENIRREPAQFLSPEEKKKELQDAQAL